MYLLSKGVKTSSRQQNQLLSTNAPLFYRGSKGINSPKEATTFKTWYNRRYVYHHIKDLCIPLILHRSYDTPSEKKNVLMLHQISYYGGILLGEIREHHAVACVVARGVIIGVLPIRGHVHRIVLCA